MALKIGPEQMYVGGSEEEQKRRLAQSGQQYTGSRQGAQQSREQFMGLGLDANRMRLQGERQLQRARAETLQASMAGQNARAGMQAQINALANQSGAGSQQLLQQAQQQQQGLLGQAQLVRGGGAAAAGRQAALANQGTAAMAGQQAQMLAAQEAQQRAQLMGQQQAQLGGFAAQAQGQGLGLAGLGQTQAYSALGTGQQLLGGEAQRDVGALALAQEGELAYRGLGLQAEEARRTAELARLKRRQEEDRAVAGAISGAFGSVLDIFK